MNHLKELYASFTENEITNQIGKLLKTNNISTDFDIVFRETNTSLATRNNNLLKGSLTGSKIVHFIVSKEECFFIDSEHSLKVANILFSEE